MKFLRTKKRIALILSFIFMLTLIQVPFETNADISVAGAADTYIKIRYDREDEDYEGWHLWVWEDGEDGQEYEFIGEDEDGIFAVVETSAVAGNLGFILKKDINGNSWAERYFEGDKWINLSSGDKEVIIEHKEENRDFEVINLNRNFDNVTLNLNYYRFNNDYNNWSVWGWLDGISSGSGKEYTLEVQDQYTRVATMEYTNVVDAARYGIGFKVKRGNWVEEDINYNRHINLAYANNNGEINAYIVQGNGQIMFSKPSVATATINSDKEIIFTTDLPLYSVDMAGKIRVKKDGELVDISLYINSDKSSGTITVIDGIDIFSEYVIEIDGYESKVATLGGILDSEGFETLYHFDGELGAIYSQEKTEFVLWAPIASNVKLALYTEGNDVEAYKTLEMNKGENGTWNLEVAGDLDGIYYTYLVTNNGVQNEVTDPYAKAVGVNGNRAMVLDMDTTDPEGWDDYIKPVMEDPTDAIIYELHIRDFTIHESSGASLGVQGKYDGVWESGTTLFGNGEIETGIDHLVDLGITHLHLLPTFDHRSIDETNLDTPQYNWGYDPQNYNVPEGSYSSNPYLAEVRVEEFKEMVMALNKAGIRVVLDVVYNHTGATVDSHLNYAVPDYYYRQNAEGGFANGSGCGNEIASERSMVRKMIVDSVVYWAEEYHIDGFRFDLMALHDIETMKQVRTELDKIDKTILVYGEGWQAGGSPLPDDEQAKKDNIWQFGEMQVASFSDDIRDAIKGNTFEASLPGFINGQTGLEESIKFGIVASTQNNQVNSRWPWANQPYQTVTYAAAHDNYTLWDKLQGTNPNSSEEELVAMNKMAGALVLTSQGISFLHAGDELARTKVNEDGSLNHNSYNSPDSVNQIDWQWKEDYNDLYQYYKGLIELRKEHDSFTMNTTNEIQRGINFFYTPTNVVAYTLNGSVSGDIWDNIAVIFNPNKYEVEVTLPASNWTVVVNGDVAGTTSLGVVEGNIVKVPAQSTYVLVDTVSYEREKPEESNEKPVINAVDVELEIGDEFNPLEGVTATDLEDGDLTSAIEVVENTVNTSEAGEYTVTYKVVDSDNNEVRVTIKVVVVSNEKPVINAVDVELEVGDEFNPLEGVTATDLEDGDLTSAIEVVENTVNTSEAGEYTVTYKVVDSDNNEVIVTINVVVVETVTSNGIGEIIAPEEVALFDTAQFNLELGVDVDEVRVTFYWGEGNKENKYEEYYQIEKAGSLTINRILRFENYYKVEFTPMINGKIYEENSKTINLNVISNEVKIIKSITGNGDFNSTNIEKFGEVVVFKIETALNVDEIKFVFTTANNFTEHYTSNLFAEEVNGKLVWTIERPIRSFNDSHQIVISAMNKNIDMESGNFEITMGK